MDNRKGSFMTAKEMIKETEPILSKYFKKVEINRIMESAYKKCSVLEVENPPFESFASQSFLVQGIFGVAVYQALEEELCREQACELTQACFLHNIDVMYQSTMLRLSCKSKAILRMSRKVIINDANSKDDENGFKYDLKPKRKGYLYCFDVLKCPIAKLLNKYNLQFLGHYLCEADEYVMKYMPKNVFLKRDKILSHGDDCCQFEYVFSRKK
ncbi:L-2-amino-thiazoline-4-carboxylic acid hydrolase (plasmid) [Clostridium estertheticum]|uniref:L-2-amino-thiazoline-4-carboxylic acid hydrolase n=1 Tax=Clostridium estertheticum TaxID=238834 RepID=UPI001C7DA8DB|nr:L-2-amino-thiazoline-4-carboxylic acid hydrolase [Clostridium estertheticum]MBX4262904.1 L-2-amino-thiazoline-4-carboxylic acid hydrolase [Clostridium estertheticum]WLC72794.1 L-2-amino-thiazoline-4-carboxylic acid hydrolase [Clostridium estertheticum]WLC72867.1 L-2-amino-thiazoline-4-carboxylic acid hydrolase [Clostridium estertheticum]WLC73105.1 L-2-amino-thiazoline-4-carboxylic acid hydrolase [Clostridium estertheticum]